MKKQSGLLRRLTALALALCMLAALTAEIFAADTVASGYCGSEGDGKNLTWTLDSEGYLTISATRTADNDEQDKKGQYIRRERYSGECSRSFYIGENIEPKDVIAKFENGILQIAFPKAPQPKQPENKRISIA